MLTLEQDCQCIDTGDVRWISIRNDVSDLMEVSRENPQQEDIEDPITRSESLFATFHQDRATLAERFPRLMVCAVALSLLLLAVTAEVDCLRGSGYFW